MDREKWLVAIGTPNEENALIEEILQVFGVECVYACDSSLRRVMPNSSSYIRYPKFGSGCMGWSNVTHAIQCQPARPKEGLVIIECLPVLPKDFFPASPLGQVFSLLAKNFSDSQLFARLDLRYQYGKPAGDLARGEYKLVNGTWYIGTYGHTCYIPTQYAEVAAYAHWDISALYGECPGVDPKD